MGTRYFDSENRIEHKNQTKRSANKRPMIQFWYLTGISVDPHHYQNTQFFFSCLHNISSSLSHSLSLLFSEKSLVDHPKENQTYPDYEVWFRFRCSTRFSMLKKCFRQNRRFNPKIPFFFQKGTILFGDQFMFWQKGYQVLIKFQS